MDSRYVGKSRGREDVQLSRRIRSVVCEMVCRTLRETSGGSSVEQRPSKPCEPASSSAGGRLRSRHAGVAAVTAVCAPFHETLNDTTVALAYLLVVLLVATVWGSWPALLASVVGVLCFNFFFLPPVYTLTIADPQNWVALAAFLVTAVTAGQLSALAKRRAAEAEAIRTETRLASAQNRSLLEASLDALVTIGSDGRINDVNSAIETLTGRSRRELIGTDFSDCFVDEGGGARRVRRGAPRRLRARPARSRFATATDTSRRCCTTRRVQRTPAGKAIGVVAAARSISTSAAQAVDRAVGRRRGEGPAALRRVRPASSRSLSDCSGWSAGRSASPS